MTKLFVSALVVDTTDGPTETKNEYREDLSYSVAPDGKPAVVAIPSAGTITTTKVNQEKDDADPSLTITTTSVRAESDDRD